MQIKAKKSLGQNFLIDKNILKKIVNIGNISRDDNILEIGPGTGNLTEYIIKSKPKTLVAVEKDVELSKILERKFNNQIKVVNKDILKLSENFYNKEFITYGNLPYNISTQLIFHLLSHHGDILDMHFMLQKEVVDRLAAQPGDNHYGRLGIMAQYYCKVEPLFIVPPEAFDPVPKVDSAIVRLIPHQTLPLVAKDLKQLERVVKTSFTMRRKTLRNNLKEIISADTLTTLNIDPSLRPERLTLKEFITIADWLTEQQG